MRKGSEAEPFDEFAAHFRAALTRVSFYSPLDPVELVVLVEFLISRLSGIDVRRSLRVESEY
ncbi:hypothetical protein N7539_006930 [Penicillium diatomitis]|uniref:Uncharacterized protein n=1 Tax=Penicillium diatomitis TaxID=2819901 RepID=A0A9W9X3C4_9EURO|nr:uncharacterized protein N7539_006930 [Penicillium diatomitis]KAJ5481036.1 hypothetical protein N7539_006930 [Penicillium diatomitis]